MEAKRKVLETGQGKDRMSTDVLQEPSSHRVPLPNHPFQAIRAGCSLGIPKTFARLHWDAGSMAAIGREMHIAGVER